MLLVFTVLQCDYALVSLFCIIEYSKNVNIFPSCLHINQDTSKCDTNFKTSTDVEQYLSWKCLWVLLKNQVRICETVHRYKAQIKLSGIS